MLLPRPAVCACERNSSQVQALAAHKPVIQEVGVGRKDGCFKIQKPASCGGGGRVSRDQRQRLCSAVTVFKGKTGENLRESWRQELGRCILLHHVQTGRLASDAILSQ